MTSTEFQDRLAARARHAGISIIADAQPQLEAYFRLLARWNAKINLTALPLRRPTDQTFDRLLIEPCAAARCVADSAQRWFDVGSGGGSPAIPMKIAYPRAELTMVESKARKVAFLREAVRSLGLSDVRVENLRFEEFAQRSQLNSIDLVTIRGVKGDPGLFASIRAVLSPVGRVFLFHSPNSEGSVPAGFEMVEMVRLGTSNDARLSILKPAVFHVEQSD